MAMKYFAVLRKDGGEADAPALGKGNALHRAYNALLYGAELHSPARYAVHLDAEVGGCVKQSYLLHILDQAH